MVLTSEVFAAHRFSSPDMGTNSRILGVTLYCLVFVLRLFNAATTRTFFQPDEYFQALEPAHALVYGYGYWTWEWAQGLRSAWHPLLYAGSYKLASLVLPDDVAVAVAPPVCGAAIAAWVDVAVFYFGLAFWRRRAYAWTALALSLASAWNWHFAARAFLNNLETALTASALAVWPWHVFDRRRFMCGCLLGFLSCIVRPTNAVLWGFLGAWTVGQYRGSAGRQAVFAAIGPLAALLVLSAVADRVLYGRWVFPLVNFVEFNAVRNLSMFYGAAPWHFYLFQGLPLMLMLYLPGVVYSAAKNPTLVLCMSCVFVVSVFSAIVHKEFRFLQPILPMLLVMCAPFYAGLRKFWWVLTILLHASVALFFARTHESGEIAVIKALRDDPLVKSIGMFTPCHSTPWHSTLHRPDLVDSSWFLTCEPPLHLASGTRENIRAYRDELDRFFDNPAQFLKTLPYPWPTHLVIFQPMQHVIDTQLPHYKPCKRFFNSYFHWDSRREGDIIVYCSEHRE